MHPRQTKEYPEVRSHQVSPWCFHLYLQIPLLKIIWSLISSPSSFMCHSKYLAPKVALFWPSSEESWKIFYIYIIHITTFYEHRQPIWTCSCALALSVRLCIDKMKGVLGSRRQHTKCSYHYYCFRSHHTYSRTINQWIKRVHE